MPKRNKNSGSAREDSQHFLKRPKPTKTEKPLVVIVCDDRKTACKYFRCLAVEYRDRVSISVRPAYCDGATAAGTLDFAEKVARSEYKTRDAKDTSIWALIDVEGPAGNQAHAKAARSKRTNPLLRVALSKPCFEVWTLLHFRDTGKQFADCKAVLSDLKQAWKKAFGAAFQDKSEIDPARLMGRMKEDACTRARNHEQRHGGCWTEVHKVIKSIEELANRAR